jgi:hypothetical protein
MTAVVATEGQTETHLFAGGAQGRGNDIKCM